MPPKWSQVGTLYPTKTGPVGRFTGFIDLGILGSVRVMAFPSDRNDGSVNLAVLRDDLPLNALAKLAGAVGSTDSPEGDPRPKPSGFGKRRSERPKPHDYSDLDDIPFGLLIGVGLAATLFSAIAPIAPWS